MLTHSAVVLAAVGLVASTSSCKVKNEWVANGSVTPTEIPLGDGNLSTTTAAKGSVFTCTAPNPNAGGSNVDGPWIHGDTWDSTQKVKVQGSVDWPSASYSMTVTGDVRTIVTNDLPHNHDTGTYPISPSDPAYQYDRNPNEIAAQSTTVNLPVTPTALATPKCVPLGPIGILTSGVYVFNALDGPGRDAAAHEAQDVCDGHPERSDAYHYHAIPSCIRDAATGPSTLVGWAADGYPIYVERDASGNLPTNADLDECHGRTSNVLMDGKVVNTYHYSATLEYPYSVGCFHGTPTVIN